MVKSNPLSTVVKPSEDELGATKAYEVYTMCPSPLCFISWDYTATTVHRDNLELRENLTVCKMPVASGAGYNFTRLPMDKIVHYSLATTQLCCLAPKGDLAATVKPTGYTQGAPVKGPDTEDFLRRMWARLPVAHGKPALPYDEKPAAVAAFVTRCGANTKTISVYSNGLVTLVEVQGGMTTIKNVDVAVLSELSYIRYTKAPPAQAICFGKENRIELVFDGDTYIMESNQAAAALPALSEAVKTAMLGRVPSANIKTVAGALSKIEIGPEFTTIEETECAWAGEQCMNTEVTTVKTSDISYLRATLPSTINAFIRAVRDIEFAIIADKCSRIWGSDLVMLPVWPCSFFSNSWVAIVLLINALVSVFRFLVIFLCRKTAVILGGPGPAKTVVLPTVVEKPEEMLQDLANSITVAQASYTWPVAQTMVYSGAPKSV